MGVMIKIIKENLFEKINKIEKDERLYLIGIISSMVIIFIGMCYNVVLKIDNTYLAICELINLILIVQYFKKGKQYRVVWIVMLIVNIALNWLTNGGGSSGSVPMWFFCILIISVIILKGKKMYILLSVNFAVFLGLILYEYFDGSLITQYSSRDTRYIDLFITSFMQFSFVAFFVEKFYNEIEKEKKVSTKLLNELKIANDTKDRFFSIIAHDLKGPMKSIIDIFEYIEENKGLSLKEKAEIYSDIKKSSNLTYLLLENLLTWARMQKGDMPYKPKNIDISNSINSSIAFLDSLAKNKKIQISSKLETGLFVFADEKMVESVIRNLLSNAIKFTFQNGRIEITGETTGDIVKISVIDNGTGIREEIKKEIFSKVSTRGTAGEEGTGLGLVLCREFLEMNGGKIWVESESGKGSTFIFTLPLKK